MLLFRIELRNKLVGTFTEDDVTFLDALAGPIAIAIENARLYQQVRQSEA
jgi:transcriptional regulator with GAF, ATPase, and Fis domain